MRILMNMWPCFVLSHSGDYYANAEVAAMRRQFPDMEFLLVRSPKAIIAANARALLLKGIEKSRLVNFRRWIFEPLYYLQFVNYLPAGYPRRVGADVIFAHGQYPWLGPKCSVPMVAVQYFASEQHLRMAGTLDLLPLEIRAKTWSMGPAQVILTTTPSSKDRIEQYIPAARGRVWQAPLYMPYVEPVTDRHVLEKHREAGEVRVLFVGGEARRKGLPQLLEAFRRLERPVRDKLRLTVVSNFRDGAVLGIDQGIEVLSDVEVLQVIQLMRDAHIFAFPIQMETYGRVIVEAMASGCAIVCGNADPQNWMLDYGRAGIGADATSSLEIAAALGLLAEDSEIRTKYALAALTRFREVFYHRVVAVQLRHAFEAAIESRDRTLKDVPRA